MAVHKYYIENSLSHVTRVKYNVLDMVIKQLFLSQFIPEYKC